ncbi:P-loop containing nucleoside triphosphate hydrolase protein [Colletotrichum scovillei]|uniref:P-loop containing nucleoside triphosphate hydrolase protein n=1 Tax=Colletotrichum scovillei TaxID=1209932 RepID=A0A9P7UDC7_9PEZI|nr:P-loop containing nucleoside triphosphate hydrolase protein [Colletotrichum scovillei]KAG7060062.1 P-loop containing nucleoside triphosphate hydrolase protein [Colletotrichum scovillei]KAG7067473.1 P-loop containing nucleoside triphosphate hydrolase protein [Colletotrichum scovillei]
MAELKTTGGEPLLSTGQTNDKLETAVENQESDSSSEKIPESDSSAQQDTDDGSDRDSGSGKDDEPSKKAVQNLYEGKKECNCCINWVEEEPENKKEAATGTVITVRRNRDHEKEKSLSLHSILVHSEQLKDTLRDVLRGTGSAITSRDFVLERPFENVFHRWAAMTEMFKKSEDKEDLQHFKLLYEVLSTELGDFFDEVNDLLSNSLITYPLLWTIFPRGEICLSADELGQAVAVRARNGAYSKEGYRLKCDFIDTDGKTFGLAGICLEIPCFKDAASIASLPVSPLKYNPEAEGIKEILVRRGRRFAELSGFHHKKCNGQEWYIGRKDAWQPRKSTGRIIIDPETFDDNNPAKAVFLRPLSSDENDVTSFARSFKLVRDTKFTVDDVGEIEWNDTCASNLILPNGYKDLLLSLVEEQMLAEDGFDDFIEQKGQGLVLLLSGDTGVGKTLTAEVVAEKMRAPLYAVSAGQLGFDAEELEARLKLVLDIASKWDAVLLLDEGDVFLERRTTSDLHRNRLVSIFLQLLEYYSGTLIITTNRAAVIDEAIKSRIHINIRLPGLTIEARKSLWENLLKENKIKHGLIKADFQSLAEVDVNGREIKNALKSGILMARKAKEPVSMTQLRVVLDILTASKTT